MLLTEAERKVMVISWAEGPLTAKEFAKLLNTSAQWSKTTSYTMLKRCIDKGYLLRSEPNFVCTACISPEEVAEKDTQKLLMQSYQGSAARLITTLIEKDQLSQEELTELYKLLKAKCPQ